MQSQQPRVLVISHNVFSASGNMGKTMMHMLAGIAPENLAQLYFHQETPTRNCCVRYFRITDSDVLHSVFTRRAGFRVFGEADIDQSLIQSRTDTGNLARVYQFSRRRTPMIYFLRNTMWSMGKWKIEALQKWAKDFAPDVIFFAAGDYAFSYYVALYLSDYLNIPIVMWCADDYFIEQQNVGSALRRRQCRQLLELAKQAVEKSKSVVTISDAMQDAYSRLLGVEARTIRISSQANPYALPSRSRSGIVYVGNLGINRITPLIELGRTLKDAALPGYETIKVYSGERNGAIIEQINENNGLTYCGCVSEQEVEKILGASKFVVFTEAFDESSVRRTRYSLSTKVAESLRSGACILAYGPAEIAAIDYLSKHKAAFILNKASELPEAIVQLCEQDGQYDAYIGAAQALAERFHDSKTNEKLMNDILQDAITNYTAEGRKE